MAERWAAATALATIAAATGEAGQPTSIALDCLQVRHLHKLGGAAMGDPHTISRAASCGRWRQIPGRAARLHGARPCTRGAAQDVPRDGSQARIGSILRARVEALQMSGNRLANAAQTACKRAVNGVQTDQAHGVGKPDPRHPDG